MLTDSDYTIIRSAKTRPKTAEPAGGASAVRRTPRSGRGNSLGKVIHHLNQSAQPEFFYGKVPRRVPCTAATFPDLGLWNRNAGIVQRLDGGGECRTLFICKSRSTKKVRSQFSTSEDRCEPSKEGFCAKLKLEGRAATPIATRNTMQHPARRAPCTKHVCTS